MKSGLFHQYEDQNNMISLENDWKYPASFSWCTGLAKVYSNGDPHVQDRTTSILAILSRSHMRRQLLISLQGVTIITGQKI